MVLRPERGVAEDPTIRHNTAHDVNAGSAGSAVTGRVGENITVNDETTGNPSPASTTEVRMIRDKMTIRGCAVSEMQACTTCERGVEPIGSRQTG